LKKLLPVLMALLMMSVGSTCLYAATIGTDISSPGFSAKDILIQNPISADGAYWIDPDLPGGDAPFQIFADMTTMGGGWTMAHDLIGGLPTLDGNAGAINILAVDQVAQIRFAGVGFDAFYSGNYFDALPGVAEWTVIFGDPSALYGTAWNSSFTGNDVFIRESLTTPYPPAAVPIPATAWLLGSALGLIGWFRRKSA
jgi:hypothetical protein